MRILKYCHKNSAYRGELRVDFRKNLLSWNLGGQQIVPRPFFSDSPYKNRVPGKFPLQTDTSWRIFWGRKRDDLKNCQKLPKSIFSPIVPNRVRLSWNSYWRSKTLPATRFELTSDVIFSFLRHRPKTVFVHFLGKIFLSPIYRGPLCAHVV